MKSTQKFFANLAALVVLVASAMLGWIEPASAAGLGLVPLALGNITLGQVFPNMEMFRQHMSGQIGAIEVIRQSLYDTLIYPLLGTVELRFFQNPLGQGLSASPGNANGVKALTDTNMDMAGALPSPQGFWVQSIEVDVEAGNSAAANTFAAQTGASSAAAPAAGVGVVQVPAINDANSLLSSGALIFNIGQKQYLREAPLKRFPPKARKVIDAAFAGNSATTANFGAGNLASAGRPYVLEPGLALQTSQNFNVLLQWPVIVATPSGFNAAIRVILDGWLFRAVQ